MPDADVIRQRLDLIRVIALTDFFLLAALVAAAVGGDGGTVAILGPIHGVGFLALVYLCLKGAGGGLWGYWYPIAVVVTAGPVGSFVGDIRIRRSLLAPAAG